MRWWVGSVLAVGLMMGAASSWANDLDSILQGVHREAGNPARDPFRHPGETLAFFGVEPGHSVVEVWPGKGWYTEILAPWLRDRGTLYAAHFDNDSKIQYFRDTRQAFDYKLAANPDLYDQVQVTELEPPAEVDIAPEASADRVLTFRNVHNWLKSGKAEAVFQAMFKALKPGGVLGVVEHRAAPGTSMAEQIKSGYVTEAKVKELAQAAGFAFVAASEINANPKDSKDHPAGVWTLPPTLRLQDENLAQYTAIGESDRMTLKFVKP